MSSPVPISPTISLLTLSRKWESSYADARLRHIGMATGLIHWRSAGGALTD